MDSDVIKSLIKNRGNRKNIFLERKLGAIDTNKEDAEMDKDSVDLTGGSNRSSLAQKGDQRRFLLKCCHQRNLCNRFCRILPILAR